MRGAPNYHSLLREMRLSAGAGFVVAQNNDDLDEAIRLYTRAIQSREFNNRFLAITYYNRGNVQFVARDYLAQSPITTSPSAWRPISPRPITTAPMRNISSAAPPPRRSLLRARRVAALRGPPVDYGDKPAAAKRSLLTPPRWSLFAPPLTG